MKQSSNNPTTNCLSSGIDEIAVSLAVERSGYPLQTIVGGLLREKKFYVQEEWGYIDRTSKELRAIDLWAQYEPYNVKEQPRVRPHLNLLIECKQSALPYIFFISAVKPVILDFPTIAGLRTKNITVSTDDSPSSWTMGIPHVLELHTHPFFKSPEYCVSFSKCVRKGAELELSGSDPYNSLILPLLKSILHFQEDATPVTTALYFDAHLTLAIGVVDAPMVGVYVNKNSNELILLPWVRVLRHEYFEEEDRWERSRISVVDVVHKDYFQVYLDNSLLPFAEHYGTLVLKNQQVLAGGEAFVSGMEKDCFNNIQMRLEPKDLSKSLKRTTAIGKRILRPFNRKEKH